jgi:hypothetical protein
MKAHGEIRFALAFLCLLGSAVAAATALCLAGLWLSFLIMAAGGIGSAMLAGWWCRYYD